MPDDLADVYRTTYPALVRFLYRKVWDAERAEDLAQEAFSRALTHRPENPRGWLFVVAANMARDEARKARARAPGTSRSWPRSRRSSDHHQRRSSTTTRAATGCAKPWTS